MDSNLSRLDLIDTINNLRSDFKSMVLLFEVIDAEYYRDGRLDPLGAVEVRDGIIGKGHEDFPVADFTHKVCLEYPKFMGYLDIIRDYVNKGYDITTEIRENCLDSRKDLYPEKAKAQADMAS